MAKLEKMAKDLEELQALMNKPKTLSNQAAGMFQEERRRIYEDPFLNTAGRAAKIEETQNLLARELMKELSQVKADIKSKQDKIVKEAESIVIGTIEKASEHDSLMFQHKFEQIKAEIGLSPNKDVALRNFKKFVQTIDHPSFAREIRNEFSSLANSLGGLGVDKTQLHLILKEVTSKAMTEEQKRALEIKESVESARQSDLLLKGGMHHSTLSNIIGHHAADFVNSPDEYLAKHTE
ncbi:MULTISPECIES: hypothetical protein [Bacillus]|uniref:hypothetical protein n=1 Tax=Bacillus TaxID=1386 RepID=UPI000406A06F|nr:MULTISPECIES: hypothetical protein [Bacillus]ATH73154.1 hypothetical protein CFN77_13305 [Bacillus altitudinis]KEP30698.1 hypothetical protein ER50_06955 [Bacillus safensis]KIL16379.1 hypothetical protein B4107_2558 [Bacillus safensis]